MSTDVKRIDSLERLTNSTNGNPRYRVHFTDGTSANTAADHSFVYSITNRSHLNSDVRVTIGGRGTITDLEPVSAATSDDADDERTFGPL